jgi:hypothetical protein
MKIITGKGPNAARVIVSLCDYSGRWTLPWQRAGHTVLLYDLKRGDDVTKLTPSDVVKYARYAVAYTPGADPQRAEVYAVLAAPPCTDFSVSGAQYWPAKDADGTTDRALAVLDACVRIATALAPNRWMLENSVGRIPKLRPALGKPRVYVDPYQFAHLADNPETERYTKKTGLWGCFDAAMFRSLSQENGGPVRVCAQGSWLQKLGGKSERTKELRSMTPVGLAQACHAALVDLHVMLDGLRVECLPEAA